MEIVCDEGEERWFIFCVVELLFFFVFEVFSEGPNEDYAVDDVALNVGCWDGDEEKGDC